MFHVHESRWRLADGIRVRDSKQQVRGSEGVINNESSSTSTKRRTHESVMCMIDFVLHYSTVKISYPQEIKASFPSDHLLYNGGIIHPSCHPINLNNSVLQLYPKPSPPPSRDIHVLHDLFRHPRHPSDWYAYMYDPVYYFIQYTSCKQAAARPETICSCHDRPVESGTKVCCVYPSSLAEVS